MAQEPLTNTTKLIIIGGSSGSLEALLVMLPLFKTTFNIPVILVLHRSNNPDNGLAQLLAARTNLQVKEADEKDSLQPGWIYIAPPDYHLLVEEDGTLSLDQSEKVNYCRPSIDVSFISAAEAYKDRLTAVLLSGANADGAAGMKMVKICGGNNIVQDPASAQVSYMPQQALLVAPIDDVASPEAIAHLLNGITGL